MNIFLRTLVLASFIMVAGCQQKAGETHDDEAAEGEEDTDNQALYDEVMQIHDEVMPKMDDLYKAKTALKTKLANTPNISESEKKEINNKIAALDSAGEGMMVWMRQFDPLPDSLGEEKARAYLENEMVKIKKVKENILEALQETAESKK